MIKITTTYCNISDVKRVLQNSFKFGENATPNKDDVESFINEAEDEIDHRTQNSWRSTEVTNEFYNLPFNEYFDYSIGLAIHLRHRNIKTLSSTVGDKIELWTGSEYIDWLTDKTEGRGEDFWLEEEQGILHLRYYYAFYREKALRLTYRYGETTVPKDIRKATAMMAAIDLIQSDDMSAMLDETGDPTRMSHLNRIERMQKQIDVILTNRTELSVI